MVGLGNPGWFQRGKLEAKFKSKVAAEEAAHAQAVAAAKASAAAEAAAAAVAAADAASEKRRSSTTVAPVELAPEEQEEQRWRRKFESAATGTASFELGKPEFKALVKKLLVKELMKLTDMAKPGDPPLPPPPADVDLDAAFKVADADKSGLVDEEEFVKLMRLVKAGKVEGLGDKGFFGFGGVHKQKQFKEDLATAKEADNASKSAKLAQLQREAASGDELAAAAAQATELSEKARVALAEAQAAQAAAAEKAEKAQALEAESANLARNNSIGGVFFGGEKESTKDATKDDSKTSPTKKAEDPAPLTTTTTEGPTSTIGGDDSEPEEAKKVQGAVAQAPVAVAPEEVAPEKKAAPEEPAPKAEFDPDAVVARLYEAPDGFRGSYEDVVAHEKKLGLATGSEHTVNKKGSKDSNLALFEVNLTLLPKNYCPTLVPKHPFFSLQLDLHLWLTRLSLALVRVIYCLFLCTGP